MEIRSARIEDAEGINDIGNYYIQETPANFKVDPLTLKEREEWMQGFSDTGRYRLLVGTENGRILGYACSASFHERCAYQTSIATAIYLHADARGKGMGSRLYTELFHRLKDEDIHRVFAGITLPNEASVGIHRKFGFTDVGIFSEAGYKYGKYWDVLWMERPL